MATQRNGLQRNAEMSTVVDQAALHGLLRKLYDLGLSLLSIKRIELD